MSEKTAPGFIDRLRESAILSDDAVEKFLKLGPFDGDKAMAKKAIDEGLLTVWQAKRLLNNNTQLKLGNYLLLDRLAAPKGCNLFKASNGGQEFCLEWDASTTGSSGESDGLSDNDEWLIAPVRTETVGKGTATIYPLPEGRQLSADKAASQKLDRARLAELLRSTATGLAKLHAQGQTFGALHATQVWRVGKTFRVGRWGVSALPPTEESPEGDLTALGVLALQQGFGTTAPSKVKPKSRLDRLVIKLADPNGSDRPKSAEEVVAAVDEWLKSKASDDSQSNSVKPEAAVAKKEKPGDAKGKAKTKDQPSTAPSDVVISASTPSVAAAPVIDTGGEEPEAAPVELPEGFGEGRAAVAAIPSIETDENEVVTLAKNEAISVEAPEFRKRNMVLTYVIYGTLGLMILSGTVVALVVVVTMQNAALVAQNSPDPEAGGAEVTPVSVESDEGDTEVAVGDDNPAPLIDLGLDEEPVAPGGGIAPVGEPAVNVAAENAEPMGGNQETPPEPVDQSTDEGPEVANNGGMPNGNEPEGMPQVGTSEPMDAGPDKPIVPAFQDLPIAVELPVVGEGDWQNEVVLGTLHLQPGDLLFAELKGQSKAFREKTSFEISNADGGTAQYAFDIVVVSGTERTRIARLDAADGSLKFKYYADASESTAANYLRNCHLRLRTGTDVGGLSLRKPIAVTSLMLDDRSVTAEAMTIIPYLPETSGVKVQMLGLSEAFPEYAFKDNVSVVQASKGTIDIIFGGKYSEALFLRMTSQLTKRLSLKIAPFAVIDKRARPFRSQEVEKTLEDATALQTLRTAQVAEIDKIPGNQQPPPVREQRQQLEAQRKQAADLVKQCNDTLQFVDSMKGQVLPVAVFFEAEDFKVYLATPDAKLVE